MAKADLTAHRLREALNYDAESGVFTWRIAISSKITPGQRAGCNSRGYIYIRVDGRMYAAHRLAWMYVHGVAPSGWIDHINGAKADNRIANLREADGSLNALNCHQPRRHNSTSGYIGVSLPTGYKHWTARITIKGITHLLGCFDTAEEARDAYLFAKRTLAPESMRGCA